MLNTLSTKAYIAATEAVRSGIQRFKKDESGVTAIEYGLIAICVTAFIIFVFYDDAGFIHAMKEKFKSLATTITGVNTDIPGEATKKVVTKS